MASDIAQGLWRIARPPDQRSGTQRSTEARPIRSPDGSPALKLDPTPVARAAPQGTSDHATSTCAAIEPESRSLGPVRIPT